MKKIVRKNSVAAISNESLDKLFEYEREVVLYVCNDERLSVLDVTGSISTYGYSVEEFTLGKICLYDIIHPEDQKLFFRSINNNEPGICHPANEFRIYSKSGEIFWVSCICFHEADNSGRILSYIVKMKDLRGRQTLLFTEEIYHKLTLRSPDAIIVCNHGGRIRYLSPKGYDMFGIDEHVNIEDLRVLSFVHPREHRQVYETTKTLETEHVAFIPQIKLVTVSGSEFYGEASTEILKDNADNTTYTIIVVRDLTRRLMDKLELQRAKEKAEESEKLKSAFLSNISYELRTPLNAITGFLNAVNFDKEPPDSRQRYIEMINQNSLSLLKIIDTIVDTAKIEVGQLKLKPAPLYLNNFMDEIKGAYESYLHQRHRDEKITLQLDNSGFIEPCIINADADRLRQVFDVLIDNAIKFTEKGFINFGYFHPTADVLEFFVEDSGVGLSEEYFEVVFEPFRQFDLSFNRKRGLGLGLTIARSIVELMGGKIWMESDPGIGSTFYFKIPFTRIDENDIDISLWEFKDMMDDNN